MTREKSEMASVYRPRMVSVMPRSPYASVNSGLALIAASKSSSASVNRLFWRYALPRA